MLFRRSTLALAWLLTFPTLHSFAQEDHWKNLNGKVQLLEQAKRYAEAFPLAEETLRVAQATFPKDSPYVAMSVGNLARLYEDQANYPKAEPLYQQVIDILSKALGTGDANVAAARNNLAECYRLEGKYAEAEPLLKQALEVLEKTPGRGSDIAASLNNLGLVYEVEARYAEAEREHDLALLIRERVFGAEDPIVADSLNNLGQVRRDQGNYAEAEVLYLRAIAIYDKASGPDSPDVSATLNNLGAVYSDQGMYAEAESYYQRALSIDQKVEGEGHPDVATDLTNLGTLYEAQGEFDKADPLLRRALDIDKRALTESSSAVVRDMGNLGTLYQQQGRYDEAGKAYDQALAITTKANISNREVAVLMTNFASIPSIRAIGFDLVKMYQDILTIDENILGKDHPDVARDLNNLAVQYIERHEYADAESAIKRAAAILEKSGVKNPLYPLSLHNLAMIYTYQEKYSDAEPLFQRSLVIDEETLGKEHLTLAQMLSNYAMFYYAQGKYAKAAPLFDRSVTILRHQFTSHLPYMSEKDRLSFLDTLSFVFPLYSSFCLTYREQDQELAGKLYDLVLWEKGMVASGIAAMRAKVASSGDQEALAIFGQLAADRGRLANLRNSSPGDPREWAQNVERLEEESNRLETSLARHVGPVAESQKLAAATWQDIVKALEPDAVAVEMVRFEHHDGKQWSGKSFYIALVLNSRSTCGPTLVKLGEASEIEGIGFADYEDLVTTKLPEANAGTRFYHAVWEPLKDEVKTAKRVYVAADGVLNQVSWAGVPTDDGRLLNDVSTINVVLSTRDLLRQKHAASRQSAVLFGNPQFDLSESQLRNALAELQKSPSSQPQTAERSSSVRRSIGVVAKPGGAALSSETPTGRLRPLPETAAEVGAIRTLLEGKAWAVESYTQEHALEEAIKKVSGPRLLHVATHGFFEADQEKVNREMLQDRPSGLEDPMLRSGLYFAGANRTLSGVRTSSDIEDGVLTAYEATGLNLQGTELVVLSACETGLGQVKNGEGVFGLRRALQEAGAEAVLMSMWSVPEDQTQELMALFYGNWLAGKDKHDALHDAQLELRKRLKERWGVAPPYYWAAFVLVD